MFAPLMGRRPKRKPRPPKSCIVPGCTAKIPHWKWLCDTCFRSLPFARRKSIAEAGQARNSQLVYGLCQGAAEWIVERREADND